jgi:hypothetical protein
LKKFQPILLVVALMAAFFLPNLLTTGLFGDGLVYAVVSRNLAAGQGSWWSLYYSDTIFAPFAEHPPLLFWLESCWFRLLGDHPFTEKTFSVLLSLPMAFSLAYFWKKLQQTQKKPVLGPAFPLFLWLIIPGVHWAYPNNMIENLLVLWTSWAVWLGIYRPNWQKSLLAGLLIFLAVMTKGVVGLFPLAVFGLYKLCYWPSSWRAAIVRTGLALTSLLVAFGLLMLLPAAKTYWQQYVDVQLLATLQGERLVQDHVVEQARFTIIRHFFAELLNPLLVLIIMGAFLSFKRFALKDARTLLFLLLGIVLAGTLPLLISPKQHAFYLLPVFPWLALALALIGSDFAYQWQQRILKNNYAGRLLNSFSILLLCASIVAMVYRAGETGRDEDLQQMVHVYAEKCGSERIGLDQSLLAKHSIQGYFQRFYGISLALADSNSQYWLASPNQPVPAGFRLCSDQNQPYWLYCRDH